MWDDNETDIDLLGFDQLVDALVELVHTQHLLPLTIGVFGDWGSGKSSLMKMADKRLAQEDQYVCVSFSPWQYEDYDDVKAALMASVLTALRDRRRLFEKVGDTASEQASVLWTKLAKRIDWFRAIGFAAKGVGTLAMLAHGNPLAAGLAGGSLDDLRHLLRPDQLSALSKEMSGEGKDGDKKETKVEVRISAQENETIEQSIGEFRRDFQSLLERLNVAALVVFVDDLDRCLPENIVNMLEALRLFLAVPKTAFVIGADERIVRHAISLRYPEMPGQAVHIGRDYLEKMVHIPLRIPPMTPSETETYLNLLGCQIYLTPERYQALVAAAAQNRANQALATAMNYGIAAPFLGGSVPANLEGHMALVSRIGPFLCGEYQGNPRYTKRFMNTLLLRQRLARTRTVSLDQAVLAKLMLLEYFHEPRFRELFKWLSESGETRTYLERLEEAARTEAGTTVTLPAAASGWREDPPIREWLALDPELGSVNLDPYFYFSRDRVFTPTAPSRRLSQQLQELQGKLLSESAAERGTALTACASLSAEVLRPLYDELLDRFQRDPRALNNELGPLLVDLAGQHRELVPALAQALRGTPTGPIQPALALRLANVLAPLAADLQLVLEIWQSQTSNSALAAAAERALRPPSRGRSR